MIVIRGNITPMMEKIELMAKEREEREKAEREAKLEAERKEREAKAEAWKKEHPVLDKYTYISHYNYETYSWPGDYWNVFFYEWSNINSEPRHFPYSVEFLKFLDSSKIMPTDENINKIKLMKSGCYITCKPGCTDLIVGENYESMKSQFNAIASLGRILATVPDVTEERVAKPKNNLPAIMTKREEKKEVKVLSCKVFPQKIDYA